MTEEQNVIDVEPYFKELNEEWVEKCSGKRLIIIEDNIYWGIRDDYELNEPDEKKLNAMIKEAFSKPQAKGMGIQNDDGTIASEYPQFTTENCITIDVENMVPFTAGLYCTDTKISPEQARLFLGTRSENPENPNMIPMILNPFVKEHINDGIDKSYDGKVYFYFMNAYCFQAIWGETAELAETLTQLSRMPLEVQRLALQIRYAKRKALKN